MVPPESYHKSMAVPAKKPRNQSSPRTSGSEKHLSSAQHMAVRLYAAGKTRTQVARLIGPGYFPDWTQEYAQRAMKKKLRSWEETQWFRDAVYDYTMMKTDMDIPRIMAGVRSRARRGRVDAARLALEVTGRHNPRGQEQAPAVVQITFGGAIPRPMDRATDQPYGPEEPHTPQLEAQVIEEAEIVDEEPQPKGPSAREVIRKRLGL